MFDWESQGVEGLPSGNQPAEGRRPSSEAGPIEEKAKQGQ